MALALQRPQAFMYVFVGKHVSHVGSGRPQGVEKLWILDTGYGMLDTG